MTWVRIDDTFPEHPKVVGLSAVAFRLHVAAICYASRNLTDGFIPLGAVRTLPGGTPNRVKELADAGLWITDGPGWQPANLPALSPPTMAWVLKSKWRA